jgi:hypothetical protein
MDGRSLEINCENERCYMEIDGVNILDEKDIPAERSMAVSIGSIIQADLGPDYSTSVGDSDIIIIFNETWDTVASDLATAYQNASCSKGRA